MELIPYLQSMRETVNEALDAILPPATEPPEELHKAMRYAVTNGGKRLRPILVLTAAQMLDAKRDDLMPLACSTELIHTASLVLDDLPSMDNATLRRAKPSTHRAFGEDGAILAAISLLMLSYEQILHTGAHTKANSARLATAIRLAAAAVGSHGMAAGQYADLHTLTHESGLSEVEFVHSRKTGALFCMCMEATATLAGANNAEVEALTCYAKNLGLAFQIVDDLLDVIGKPEQTGKDTGLDRDKTTFVDLCGVDKATLIAHDLVATAKAALEIYKERADTLLALADYVVDRKN